MKNLMQLGRRSDRSLPHAIDQLDTQATYTVELMAAVERLHDRLEPNNMVVK